MLVEPARPELRGETVRIAAKVRPADGPAFELVYRVLPEVAGRIPDSSDAFAVALVFFAMRSGEELRIEGRVSPSLLENLERFQEIWSCWRPERYRVIPVRAAEEREVPAGDPRTALALYSGGVDAAEALHLHHARRVGRRSRSLESALMVCGMGGYQGEAAALFQADALLVRDALGALGIPFVSVLTNWQAHVEVAGLSIFDAFGAGFLACMHLVRGRAGAAVLGSGDDAAGYAPSVAGSTPLTDPLLGCRDFPVLLEGAACSRVEKLRQLAGAPGLLRVLRVCNATRRSARNCGGCDKCLRTALAFRVAGLEPAAGLRMPRTGELEALPLGHETVARAWASLADEARAAGLGAEPWMVELSERLARSPASPGVRGEPS